MVDGCNYCSSVCVSDGERETVLEAGAGGGDGERPVVVQQFASMQGGLAEPHTHLSTFSNTVSS